MNSYRAFAALLCAAALAACGDTAVQTITGPFPSSRVKFFNFGVGAPGVNFYANGTKMTAITSGTGTESTTGTTYGNAGAGGFYTAIAPGQYTLAGKIAAATDKDLAIASAAATIADGKAYSFYVSGVYNSTAKTADAFVVADDFTVPTDTATASVRFVNAISTANPMTLYARNPTTGVEVAVGGSVAYGTAGAFTSLPAGVYDLNTRYAGSSTNVITRTGVSFIGRRVFTITARGDVTSSVTANKPVLDNTANY